MNVNYPSSSPILLNEPHTEMEIPRSRSRPPPLPLGLSILIMQPNESRSVINPGTSLYTLRTLAANNKGHSARPSLDDNGMESNRKEG